MRIRVRAVRWGAAAIVGLILPAFTASAVADPVDRSVTYQGGPAHTGELTSGPAPPLVRAWTFKQRGPSSYPVFDDTHVFFVVTELAEDEFSEQVSQTRLYALDTLTGEIAWTRPTVSGRATLAYDAGRVFARGSDGQVIAYSALTGATHWAHQTPGFHPRSDVAVVADRGLVYVAGTYGGKQFQILEQATGEVVGEAFPSHWGPGTPALDSERVYLGTQCSILPWVVALDRDDATPVWPGRGCGGLTPHNGHPIAVHDGMVWAAHGRYDPHAVYNAADGAFVRSYEATYLPALAGPTAYIVDGGSLRAEATSTGVPIWAEKGPGNLSTPPQLIGDYLFAGSEYGALYAFDPASGNPVWQGQVARRDAFQPDFHGFGSNGELIVAAAEDRIVAFATTGSDRPVEPPAFPGAATQTANLPAPTADAAATNHRRDSAHSGFVNAAAPVPPLVARWSQPVPEPGGSHSTPLIAGGRVFMTVRGASPSARDEIRAIDLATGTTEWTVPAPEGASRLAYGEGKVFVYQEMSGGSMLLALDAATGAQVWAAPLYHLPGEPVAAGGRVYVNRHGTIQGWDAETGAPLPEVSSLGSSGDMPTVAGGRVYASGVCRHTSAFPLELGPPLWEMTSGCHGGGGSISVFGDGKLFMREDFAGYVLNAADGELLDAFQTNRPLSVAGQIMLSDGPRGVTAQDTATGAVLWEYPGIPTGAVSIVGRHVYVPLPASLAVLSLATGELVWSSDQYGPPWRGFTPYDRISAGEGTVLVSDGDILTALESAPPGTNPPETTITTPIPPVVTEREFAVQFGASDPAASFECRVNEDYWRPCSAEGFVLGGPLIPGDYLFEVRARSAGGLDLTPATARIVARFPTPETELTGPGPGTGAGNTRFELTGSDFVAMYECRLDGGFWDVCENGIEFEGLADGLHTLEARSYDDLDQVDPTPAQVTWMVGVDPPEVLAPPEVLITGAPAPWSSERAPVVAFTATGEIAGYTCRVGSESYACRSGERLHPVADGLHMLEVTATDTAGNVSPQPAVAFFGVDTRAPETQLLSAAPKRVRSRRPKVSLTSNERATFECRLDDAAFDECPAEQKLPRLKRRVHIFEARAIDLAGNRDATPVEWRFRVRRPRR